MGLFTVEPPSIKFLYFIFYIILGFMKELFEEKIGYFFVDPIAKYFEFTIIYTIGDLLCGFFALIVKKRTNSGTIEEKPIVKKKINSGKIDLSEKNTLIYNKTYDSEAYYIPFKRLIYLSLFDLLGQSCNIIYAFLYKEENFKLPHHDLNLSLIFDIISRFFLNKIFLKNEFYPHYYLSITINVISSSILCISDIYFIFIDKKVSHWIYLVKTIIAIFLYSLENVEGKIGLNCEFLNVFSLLFYKGVIQTFFLIIISLIFIILKQYYLFTGLFDNNEYPFNLKFGLHIGIFLLINMLSNICIWKIIDLYTIQHLTIAKGGVFFASYISSLFQKKLDYQIKEKIYYFYFTDIFGFILLFIGTLIHNEIIILNFCGLNKYTIKKLKEREEMDIQPNDNSINSLSEDNSLNSNYKSINISNDEF